jgi:hypothetical protein
MKRFRRRLSTTSSYNTHFPEKFSDVDREATRTAVDYEVGINAEFLLDLEDFRVTNESVT